MDLFTIEGLGNLAVLVMLQAVLGFDNLLYISIESKRAPVEERAAARRIGLILAIVLRVCLLFVLLWALEGVGAPLFSIAWAGVLEGAFTLKTLVFLFGGAFILYTAMKEIAHLLAIEHVDVDVERKGQKSRNAVIFWIVLMNLVFSFDSILSAVVITDSFSVLAVAIFISGAVMILLADRVAEFVEKNRMYEVLVLFILFLVGVLLMSEGGHYAHLILFGYPIEALPKATFYFSVAVMVVLDIVQGRYHKKLLAEKKAEIERGV